ncbi:MAG: ankyrin repeat domain-containing protein [Melioribacteraceae bacterium]|nr:ankyrin repeat domain-containing protein [Melioribacteraceae bacterium]
MEQNIDSVIIGEQIWMTKTLNVTHFRNGEEITELKNKDEWINAVLFAKPGFCYFDNNSSNDILYNIWALQDKRNVAPVGWHIPTNAEIDILLKELNKETNPLHFFSDKFNFTIEQAHNRNSKGEFQKYDGIAIWGYSPKTNQHDTYRFGEEISKKFSITIDATRFGGYRVRCIKGENEQASIDSQINYDNMLVEGIIFDDIGKVNEAINNGADINTKDGKGQDVILLSIGFGRFDIFKFLVESGLDINKKYKLDSNGKETTPLMYASLGGKIEIVKYLLANGVDINYEYPDGTTALIATIFLGKIEIMNLLLSAGALIYANSPMTVKALEHAKVNNPSIYTIINEYIGNNVLMKVNANPTLLLKTPLNKSQFECPVCKKSFQSGGVIVADQEYFKPSCNCGIYYDFLNGYYTKDEEIANSLKEVGYKIEFAKKMEGNPYDNDKFIIYD